MSVLNVAKTNFSQISVVSAEEELMKDTQMPSTIDTFKEARKEKQSCILLICQHSSTKCISTPVMQINIDKNQNRNQQPSLPVGCGQRDGLVSLNAAFPKSFMKLSISSDSQSLFLFFSS